MDVEITVEKQPELPINFDILIKNQPYIFTDYHKLDKKVDVKQLQFGSKIDSESRNSREDYFTVKEIISPELIKLNTDLIIRLIGVKENPNILVKAIEFLNNKFRGKRVFLRFDEQKYDLNNYLFAYLYLENKSFINAQLIKENLVYLDDSQNFKYKKKFETL